MLKITPHASDGPGRSVEGECSGGAWGFSPLQPAGYEPRWAVSSLTTASWQLSCQRWAHQPVPTPASVDRGADRDSAVPVPAFFIVGYTGRQRIIIVHDPSGTHVSGHEQYQPHVRRIWQQGGCRYQGPLGRTFTPSKPGDGLCAFADNASVTVVDSSGDALTAVASTLLNAKAVRLEGASLTPKQVHAFCDHVELLIRARVYDAQTFTLLTDPQSIMAIGLRFMAADSKATCQPIRRRCSSANSKRSSLTSRTLARIMAPTDCSRTIWRRPSRRMRPILPSLRCRVCWLPPSSSWIPNIL